MKILCKLGLHNLFLSHKEHIFIDRGLRLVFKHYGCSNCKEHIHSEGKYEWSPKKKKYLEKKAASEGEE